jgi:hypothetical protein
MKKLGKETKKLLERYRKYAKVQGTTEFGMNDFLTKEGYEAEGEFEVGDWFVMNYLGKHLFLKLENGHCGFNTSGEWCSNLITYVGIKKVRATDEEISDVLRKEAKKYIGNTVDYNGVANPIDESFSCDVFFDPDGVKVFFQKTGLGICVFDEKTLWATIIEEPKVKEMTMEDVEKLTGCKVKIIK